MHFFSKNNIKGALFYFHVTFRQQSNAFLNFFQMFCFKVFVCLSKVLGHDSIMIETFKQT